MILAMVKVLPLPVTPLSTWWRSPASTPAASASMACCWSPAGSKSATTLKGGTAYFRSERVSSIVRSERPRMTLILTFSPGLLSSRAL